MIAWRWWRELVSATPPPADGRTPRRAGETMALRPWLRRRRVLLVTIAVTLVLVPSLLLTARRPAGVLSGYGGPGPGGDYESNYDYGAVDGVHAMVHQMGRTKTKRFAALPGPGPETPPSDPAKALQDHGPPPRSGHGMAGGPRRHVGKRILHRKMEEEEEIPPEVIKGYAFLSQGTNPRVVSNSPQTLDKPHHNNKRVRQVEEDDDDYGANDDDPDIENVIIQGGDTDDDPDDADDMTDYNDYWSRNPEFKPGDFDHLPNSTKPVLRYEDLPRRDADKVPNQDPLVRNILRVRKIQNKADASNYKSDLKPRFHSNKVIQSPSTVIRRNHQLQPNYNNNVRRKVDNTLRFVSFHRPCGSKLGCDQLQQLDHAAAEIQHPDPGETLNPRVGSSRDNGAVRASMGGILGKHLPGYANNGAGSQGPSKGIRLNGPSSGIPIGIKQQEEYALHLPLAEQPATQLQMPELPPLKGQVRSNAGFPVVTDTIYWSQHVENFVPKGKTLEEMVALQRHLSKLKVAELHPPQWIRCGRPKNQYVVFDDGSAACGRYRHPHDKLLQGEVLSFYLSRLLGLDNVPITVLAQVNSSDPRWQLVDTEAADWEQNQLVVFIQWINGLDSEWSRVKMPSVILTAYETGRTLDSNNPVLSSMTAGELAELLQWSDMVLFDYIIGHYDRVASMQDGADREKKASIMSESIRNLRKVPQNNRLWLIDNESGLFDGYELLYQGKGTSSGRFIEFHRQMLRTMCLFRRSLVNRVGELAKHPHPERLLVEFARSYEPLYDKLPKGSKHKLFRNYFHTRLKEVVSWVQSCKVR